MNGQIPFGVIVAFIMCVRLFTSPLSTLAQGMAQMQTAAAAGDHIFDFYRQKTAGKNRERMGAHEELL